PESRVATPRTPPSAVRFVEKRSARLPAVLSTTNVTPARSRRTAALLLLLPCLLVRVALFVAPQALVFEASLGRRSAYGGVVHEWSAANYGRALQPLYLGILARSLGLAAITTAGCLALGLPVAYLLPPPPPAGPPTGLRGLT